MLSILPALRWRCVKRNRQTVSSATKPPCHSESDDLEGLVVDVEITELAHATAESAGTRLRNLSARQDDFGVDVAITIRKFHLPHPLAPPRPWKRHRTFPPSFPAQELRHRATSALSPSSPSTVRPHATSTTQSASAISPTAIRIAANIADVAQYVTPAPRRSGSSFCAAPALLPDRCVPMLPLELSTDICSLRPHPRPARLSCVMQIDPHGEIVGCELSEGVIRSAERMTYTAVNAVIEGDAAARERYAALVPTFELMRDLAIILNRKRQRSGSIDFDLPSRSSSSTISD